MLFTDFNISPSIQKILQARGLNTPTSIQSKAIPLLLEHKTDFVGQAQTGTGKTAAFCLPLLTRLDPNKRHIQALILSPTRELAKQIKEQMDSFAEGMGIKSVLIYGGASYSDQMYSLKKDRPQIVIGTPGRILDLMDRRQLDFSGAEFLVLDEADEMLQMGFIDDVSTIIETLHADRKIWMFSATMPKQIAKMIDEKFNTPVVIKAERTQETNMLVEQHYIVVDSRKKSEALYRLVQKENIISAMVFCKLKIQTVEVVERLQAKGVKAMALNGDMSQSQREQVMISFKSGRTNLLVCTDVAARGIDVKGLSHVFNYCPPNDLDSYTHRIGRTGRAGEKGLAYNLVSPSEMGFVRRIENSMRVKMVKTEIPSPADLKNEMVLRERDKFKQVIDAVLERKTEYKLDSSFEHFASFFKDVSKEEILKVFFTRTFNREFRMLDDMGDLNVVAPREKRFTSNDQRFERNKRMGGGGRNGNRGGYRR